MKYLLLCLSLLGCTHTPVLDITPEAQLYVTKFEVESILQGKPTEIKDLIVRFSPDLSATTLGQCTSSRTPIIELNSGWWAGATDDYKEAVVYHELGHCILDRHHTWYSTPENIPISLMFIYGVPPEVYVLHKEYYIHELFYPYYEGAN